MRLINATQVVLEKFGTNVSIPPYAILSHRWSEEEEINYRDMIEGRSSTRKGYSQILEVCRQAIADGFNYLWVDACCVDKQSDAEVHEAVRSMLQWILGAELFYVHVHPSNTIQKTKFALSDLVNKDWFLRGWTLQGFTMPRSCPFLHGQSNWNIVCPSTSDLDRSTTSSEVSFITARLHECPSRRTSSQYQCLTNTAQRVKSTRTKRSGSVAASSMNVRYTRRKLSAISAVVRAPHVHASRLPGPVSQEGLLLSCTRLTEFLRRHFSRFTFVAFCISCTANSARPLRQSELKDAALIEGFDIESIDLLTSLLKDSSSVLVENSESQVVLDTSSTTSFIRNFAVEGIDGGHTTLARVCQAALKQHSQNFSKQIFDKQDCQRKPYMGAFTAYGVQDGEFHSRWSRPYIDDFVCRSALGGPRPLTPLSSSEMSIEYNNDSGATSSDCGWVQISDFASESESVSIIYEGSDSS